MTTCVSSTKHRINNGRAIAFYTPPWSAVSPPPLPPPSPSPPRPQYPSYLHRLHRAYTAPINSKRNVNNKRRCLLSARTIGVLISGPRQLLFFSFSFRYTPAHGPRRALLGHRCRILLYLPCSVFDLPPAMSLRRREDATSNPPHGPPRARRRPSLPHPRGNAPGRLWRPSGRDVPDRIRARYTYARQ